jgi:hypothetical protein
MNRRDSAIFGAGRIQLFHLAKMDSIRPLTATFGNGRMGFFHSASSFSIRPKSAKMATLLLLSFHSFFLLPLSSSQRQFLRAIKE